MSDKNSIGGFEYIMRLETALLKEAVELLHLASNLIDVAEYSEYGSYATLYADKDKFFDAYEDLLKRMGR